MLDNTVLNVCGMVDTKLDNF